MPWHPEWRDKWPKILWKLDDILQSRFRVKTTHIMRGEKGTGTSYHSQQTGITTIIEEGEIVTDKDLEFSLEGSSGELLGGLSGDQFDFFIKDQDRLPNSKKFEQTVSFRDMEFGVNYFKRTLLMKEILALNPRELTLYHAIVTRALELDVKRVSEFFNNTQLDGAQAETLKEAYKIVLREYTSFLLNVLHRCST